jgi:hypothetical protein
LFSARDAGKQPPGSFAFARSTGRREAKAWIFVSREPEEDSAACVKNFLSTDAGCARTARAGISCVETHLIMTLTLEMFS